MVEYEMVVHKTVLLCFNKLHSLGTTNKILLFSIYLFQ
jgi:hypothetical protein